MIPRRDFLKVAAAALPVALSPQAIAAAPLRSGPVIQQQGLQALAPYLDTLLPGGESPAASELNIHGHLVDHAGGIRNYIELLKLGCTWLDALAPGNTSFSTLMPLEREKIVSLAENAAAGTIERQFFDRTLSDAMQLYYAHPRSWPALGFAGPPQPVGFPDYGDPPS